MAGLDPVPGINGTHHLMPPCASDELSNLRFYDAMSGPTWFVNATEYGHGDFLNPIAVESIKLLHFCASNDDTDKHVYRHFVSGEIASFIRVIFNDECDAMEYIQDPTKMPIKVTTQCNECDVTTICNNPYCKDHR